MNPVISLKTSRFDTSQERLNPINPIAGESILIWLRNNVFEPEYKCTDPDYEDWGWYMNVSFDGRSYMVGGIAFDEETDESGPLIEWLVQIDKNRTLKEKLLGLEMMQENDPFVQLVFRSLQNEPSFVDVEWG